MTANHQRALIVTRLSRVTDATTSPERQRQICEALCKQRGYDVVGTAEDLDVSGAVDPFDRKKRPNLSRWLVERPHDFDVLVSYRVDRVTRSLRNLQALVNWADDNGKLVVSATEQHFDTSLPFAGVLIALIGTVAEMELAAISERNASTAQFNIKHGKYRGSQPPWGYLPDNSTGVWRLKPDPEQVKVIHEVVRRVLDGEPLQRITHDLTRRGVPTPKDYFAQHRGRPTEGREWTATPLKRSLLSETMLGYAVSKGKAVRNDDGSPVVRSEPILTREVFDRVGVELAGRVKRGEPSKVSTSLLLRVLHCGVCGEPAYKFNGGSHSQYPRYRCKSATKAAKCGNKTIRVDDTDALVDGAVVTLLGGSERLVREWDSGSDSSAELSVINAELTDLVSQIGTPAFKQGTPQRDALDARIAALADRQEHLASLAVTPAGWTWKGTGQNFGDWWGAQGTEGRNVWLRSMNVRVEYDRQQTRLDLGDLYDLAAQVNPAGPIAGWIELLDAMRAGGIAGIDITGDTEPRIVWRQ